MRVPTAAMLITLVTLVYRFHRWQIKLYPRPHARKGAMSETSQTQKSGCATGKSALPSTTGIVSQTCQVRKVPIVLKKSFWGADQNFSEPLMPFARGNMRDHIVSHKNDHEASHGRYAVLQWWSRLKISFCEISASFNFRLLQHNLPIAEVA
jgi:hypothetical protein